MTLLNQLAAVAGFLLAMAAQTVTVIVWIVKLTTRLETTMETLASQTALAMLTGRVDSLQRQVDNDKQGRAALIGVREDMAAVKATITSVETRVANIEGTLRDIRRNAQAERV